MTQEPHAEPQAAEDRQEAGPRRLGLSPSDTSARCEAKGWIPYGTNVTEAAPAESFGKVDLDDESHTVCVAHVERNADGSHTARIEALCGDDEISVELHRA